MSVKSSWKSFEATIILLFIFSPDHFLYFSVGPGVLPQKLCIVMVDSSFFQLVRRVSSAVSETNTGFFFDAGLGGA